MKIEKIAYEQLYPTGVYANQRYRVEAEVLPTEDIQECFKHLKGIVEKTFVALNPQITWNEKLGSLEYNPGLGYAEIIAEKYNAKNSEPDSKEKRLALIAGDINTCKEVKVLESYKLIAKNYPELQAVYEKKMQELTKSN